MGRAGIDQLVVRMLQAACRLMWGFPPRMIPYIVDRMGALRAVVWFARNMPRYLTTLRVLGPVRTHLACVTISLRNGCTYCAYGHAYALELFHLRDRDRLFPIPAAEIAGWTDLDERELRDRLRAVLQQAGLHVEALWVDRTLDLVAGAGPMDVDEARIAHLVEMVSTMNGIATENDVAPDEAQSTSTRTRRSRLVTRRYVPGWPELWTGADPEVTLVQGRSLGGVMQLGRKLSEGFAVDLEADVLEQPPVEAHTVEVKVDLEQVEQPARV